ncbi:MAG TPA: hypothetical protein DCP28_18485, partial [Cytophagales bacterium]|nr:hypothetical protein [Cytophagales bacterium]
MTDLEGIQDLSREGFKSLLHQAADIILDLYDDVGAKKVYRSQSQEEVHALFAEDLPDTGTQIEGLLQTLQKDIIPNVALHYSPHFYAWVTSSATQASILGEMLASALNVNATTWLNAPA